METRKRALVIGGTRGLGWEIVRLAAKHGIDPIAVGRPQQNPEPLFVDDGGGRHPVRRVGAALVTFDGALDLMWRLSPNLPTDLSDVSHVFYVAGVRLKGPLVRARDAPIGALIDVGIHGLVNALRAFLASRDQREPFHLVVVTSTTSWKIRSDEAVYGMVKAAQAQFVRNVHGELPKGSTTLVAHPGGMKTEFWEGSGVNTDGFLDPAQVAAAIWAEGRAQADGLYPRLHELHIERSPDGSEPYLLTRGPRVPG